jgi:hypothetical protein
MNERLEHIGLLPQPCPPEEEREKRARQFVGHMACVGVLRLPMNANGRDAVLGVPNSFGEIRDGEDAIPTDC